MAHPTDTPCLRARLFWVVVMLCHVLAAVGVWVAMPGGFPFGHAKFWANRAFPLVVAIYALAAIFFAVQRYWRAMTLMLIVSPVALLGGAIVGSIVFPVSGRWPGLAVGVVALAMLWSLRREFRSWWPTRNQVLLVGAGAFAFGSLWPIYQRAELPDTHPFSDVSTLPTTQPVDTSLTTQRISEDVRVVPNTGEVLIALGKRSINLSPLLTFESRSPDRCWTNLAPAALRVGRPRKLCAIDSGHFTYLDDGFSTLEVRQAGISVDASTKTEIEALSILPAPVFSHLNSFTELTINGHRKLSLLFSPAPNVPIDVHYSEYPAGQPERIAYLDASGIFHVVEASSGEKGPFRELAGGPLAREEPLSITLTDAGQPFARISLLDYSSQAGVQLSPTAGWGLPVNSIEFSLYDASDKSPAGIFISLAATSVGRGWDSVGHTAGTYRNRIILESLVAK